MQKLILARELALKWHDGQMHGMRRVKKYARQLELLS